MRNWKIITFCEGKIFASLSMVEYAKARYPKRDVLADVRIPHGEMYYVSQTGKIRVIRNKNEVWIGSPWPFIRRRR